MCFQLPAVFLCLSGVCLVLQPWQHGFHPSLLVIVLGYITAALSGVLITMEMWLINHYDYLHEQTNQKITIFWTCIVGTILSAGSALVFEQLSLPQSITDAILVLIHSATYVLNLLLYMYSSTHIPGTVVSIIASTSTVYLIVSQYTFLKGWHKGESDST